MQLVLISDEGDEESYEFSAHMKEFFGEIVEKNKVAGSFPPEASLTKIGLDIAISILKQAVKQSIEL